MRLHSDEWREIDRMEAEIGRIFEASARIPAKFGVTLIPACCVPGWPGYARIVELRRTIQQIKRRQ